MNKVGLPPGAWRKPQARLLTLTAAALITGAGAGVAGAAFRASLEAADRWRNIMIASAHASALTGFLLVVGACAAATLISAGLVRRFSPEASGSGIPHVEAVLRDGIPPASYLLPPVKFVGGDLAIGAGLALGPEGPAVQLGASIAVLIGRAFRLSWPDLRALLAAGAGAGLATAFNAPLAGGAFVLEELLQSFDRRIAIAALAASATAIAVTRAVLGDTLIFHVPSLPNVAAEARPLFVLLGAVMGLVAVAYNRTALATLAAFERLPLPVEARAGLIGAAVGVLAWVSPGLVGGGDPITQDALRGGPALQLVALAFLVRFGLVAVSNAAGAPGGLFAPLLALGAQFGLMFGSACHWAIPWLDVPSESFALVGMAALLAGVVRAPLTGLVLVSEMTGNVTLLLPMLGACAMAMLVPTLLCDPPIYDSLREALLRRGRVAGLAKLAIKADADDASLVSPAGRESRS